MISLQFTTTAIPIWPGRRRGFSFRLLGVPGQVVGVVRLEYQAIFALIYKDPLQDDPFVGDPVRISLAGTFLISNKRVLTELAIIDG